MCEATMKVCSVEGCGRPLKTKGYCNGHYERVRLHGDAMPTKPLIGKVGDLKGQRQSGYLVAISRGRRRQARTGMVVPSATAASSQSRMFIKSGKD